MRIELTWHQLKEVELLIQGLRGANQACRGNGIITRPWSKSEIVWNKEAVQIHLEGGDNGTT